MRTSVFGLMLLTIVAGQSTPAGEIKKKPVEVPKEQSVVDYPSQTVGAIQVKSTSEKPSDWFDVLQGGKRAFQGNPPLLNGTLKLKPGAYVIVVNRTERKVNIDAGKKTILWTGDLMVESKRKGNYWIPKQGKETRLSSNPPVVNRRVALFPGTYTVYLNVRVSELRNLGTADVKAGRITVVKE